MKRRTVLLFVALALVTALAGFYAGMSTSTPQAATDPAADPPGSSVEAPQTDGYGQSRTPAGSPKGSGGQASTSKSSDARDSATKGSPTKDSPDKASAPKKGGNQSGPPTQSGHTPAKPPTSQPQHQAGPVRFGNVTTAGRPNDTAIADDRRALTTSFSEFEVVADPQSAEPDATKTFSMTLPLTGGTEGGTLGVHATGFIGLDRGAKGSVTLRGGGRQIIKGFAGEEEEYVQSLQLPARPGVTYQLTFEIDINRGADDEASGYLNMVTIEIGIN